MSISGSAVQAAAGGGDIWTWVNGLTSAFQSTSDGVVICLAVLVFFVGSIKGRTMPTIIMSGLAGLVIVIAYGWIAPNSGPARMLDRTFNATSTIDDSGHSLGI